MSEYEQTGVAGLGRRILLALGGSMVLLGGVLGLIVGGNGGETVGQITVGPLTVPVAPLPMTLYGMAVVALAIGGLYGLITVASRYDADAT